MEVKRLFDYLTKQLQNQADAPFISAKEFTSTGIKEWNHYSYQAFQDWCNKVSLLLLSKGLQPGDKIAIISANRAEWNMVDIGSQQIGLVNVPMYPSISEDDYAFIFRDAQIRFAFVGDSGIYQKVKSLREKIQSLQKPKK